MTKVLVIEDDLALGEQLCAHLTGLGITPVWWQQGRRPLDTDLDGIDLVVLDLMLPDVQGLDILKRLRTFSDVPVLILSARNDNDVRVRGLRLGADDYMTKPFWPEEFVERVKARLRRPILSREGIVKVGILTVDTVRAEVQLDGVELNLTQAEYNLLAILAERPGVAVSRQRLADRVLDTERSGDPRGLDVHVSRLRRKLAPHDLIKTAWGIGYRLSDES